ncbi:DUF2567 domain-containing protein [Aldersonia sp. NBC_00410]|uniref:DUF2567 domain-containing protein n=1 Tax=Aldersonia sp. NBC_00410 TaxID=2975954 RepID=UPI0022516E30|nr:DUF2567 domain-containing protein [Aldersonia sp. NBC_00410]MCX5046041.1 DUF2567 domain-containing protein [Aldersonia sp. NBC_00410]
MRAEVRTAARVVLGAVVLGAVGGIVWGLLAPPIQAIVVTAGRAAPVTGESDHEFDAVAIFACVSAVVAVLTAVGAWRLARPRGPVLYGGILLGSVTGAATMAVIGEGVARLRHPHVQAPQVDELIALAPGIGTAMVLIVAPMIASLAILVLAIFNPRDDLDAADERVHEAELAR